MLKTLTLTLALTLTLTLTLTPKGELDCEPCELGNYCTKGASSGTPCEAGRFGNRYGLG